MYFNMNDPNVALQNYPQKQDSSMHVGITISTVILWAAIIVGALGSSEKFLTGLAIGLIIGFAYLFYLIIVCLLNDIKGYITNLKKFEQYSQTY